MTAGEIISLVAVSLSIVTALLGGLLWIVKSQVTSMQKDLKPVDQIEHSMTPADHNVRFNFSQTLTGFILDTDRLDTGRLGF